MPIQVQKLDQIEQLRALQPAWNSLAGENPFASWQWLHSWSEVYLGGPRELFTLVVHDDAGAPLGILPLYRESSWANGRSLKLLGSGEVCTDYLGLFSLPGQEETVCQAIAEFLSSRSGSPDDGWETLWLEHVPLGDAVTKEFAQCMAKLDNSVNEMPALNCWRIALPESWDDYLATMSRSHRKQIRRLEKRQLSSADVKLRTIHSQAELPDAIATLVDLHQRRRNQLGEPGCFASESFAHFVDAVSPRLLSAGKLRMHLLEHAGQAVAAEWQLANQDSVYCYQAGVDPDALELEPGRLIMILTIRQAIETGMKHYDFLRGDEPYKAHFRAQPLETTTRRIAASTTRGKTRSQLWNASQTTKDWLRSAGLCVTSSG